MLGPCYQFYLNQPVYSLDMSSLLPVCAVCTRAYMYRKDFKYSMKAALYV